MKVLVLICRILLGLGFVSFGSMGAVYAIRSCRRGEPRWATS